MAEEYLPPRYPADPYVADRPPVATTFWSLESMRTALTLVGLIAVAALGVAIWALLRRDTDRTVNRPAPIAAAALTVMTGTSTAGTSAKP